MREKTPGVETFKEGTAGSSGQAARPVWVSPAVAAELLRATCACQECSAGHLLGNGEAVLTRLSLQQGFAPQGTEDLHAEAPKTGYSW